MSDYDMFRTTLMGGFDKDDVIRQFQELKENQYKEKTRLEKELKDREEKLAEMSKRLKLKEVQRERLEKEIAEKYQKYTITTASADWFLTPRFRPTRCWRRQ